MPPLIDLTGQRFGAWSVIQRDGNTPVKQLRWLCRCDCGTERYVQGAHLREKASTNCGCSPRKVKHGAARRRNGHSFSGAYRSWRAMRARILNKNHKHWLLYGGRGISICERWNDFTMFLADIGERPPGMSLDRIDSNGNYEPSNCRWSNHSDQVRNRRPCLICGTVRSKPVLVAGLLEGLMFG
jgi:hypothetical protein